MTTTHFDLILPSDIYVEWAAYADAAGLPLEFLIREAVTHSVRNDRLGATYRKLAPPQVDGLNERETKSKKTTTRTEPKNAIASKPSTTSSLDDAPIVELPAGMYEPEFMQSSDSAALDDNVPRNV